MSGDTRPIIFHARGSPQAAGRKPAAGDKRVVMKFPLDGGGELHLICGPDDMRNLRNIVLDDLINDETAVGH